MKIIPIAFIALLCISVLSCSSDDDNNVEDLTGKKGTLTLKFDNAVGDQDFIFDKVYKKSNNESYKLSVLKYIVSNVRFIDDKGKEFSIPSEQNIFIIDEAAGNNAGEIKVVFKDIQAADYTKITFGIGVDQKRYALGADGQGDFIETAQKAEMLWSWATGYRFMRFDGTYSSRDVTDEALNIHMGSVGTVLDNYRETTLTLPNTARVRPDKIPEVHIKANIAKVFDGKTSVKLSDGYNQVHTDKATTPVIANNIKEIFMAHHVHNN